jgi:hypothetical protein
VVFGALNSLVQPILEAAGIRRLVLGHLLLIFIHQVIQIVVQLEPVH